MGKRQPCGRIDKPVERFPAQKGLAEILGLGVQMWMHPNLRMLISAAKQRRPLVFTWRVLRVVD